MGIPPQDKIRTILRLIQKAYGRPPRLVKSDPVDEVIRTVLSQNTSDTNSLKAFGILKGSFRSWDTLLKIDTRTIAKLIRHAGLANIKAKRIKGILAEIRKREGRLNLAALEDMPADDAAAYLRSLRGIGPKTAACVLLFSFAKPVMPVDTHIFRVAKRLGLIGRAASIEEAHAVLTAVAPKDLIYEFHLGIIEHGRRTCKAQRPLCGRCVLYGVCSFALKAQYRKEGPRGDTKSERR